MDKPGHPKRLIVGISGASGAIYGVRLLQLLMETEFETHLIVTKAGQLTIAQETGRRLSDLKGLADKTYQIGDIGAACASGSFMTAGMIVAPCSVKTMSEIATGVTTNLLSRSADVVLKERRRLVLMFRETPLHLGHIKTMAAVTELGAVVYPPVPAFYAKPGSVDAMVDQTLGRVLDLFGVETPHVKRWNGMTSASPSQKP